MKHLVPIVFFALAVNTPLSAQISQEATYNHSGIFTYLPSVGNKFFIMDVAQKQCRIYHTDHSLWKTINLSVPANHWLYDIKYVTEGLFTSDNGLSLTYIYYDYNETGQYYTYTARIIRENGTEILTIPGCQYLLVQSLSNGSTKLLAYVYDYSVFPYTVQTKVYNLPGSLITKTNTPAINPALQPAFPNPATNRLQLPWSLPEPHQSALLHITDATGRSIKTIELTSPSGLLELDVVGWPSGNYLYYIENQNFKTATGKFVLTKP